MRNRHAIAFAGFTVVLLTWATPLGAYWVDNGTIVCGADSLQTTRAITADGFGGAIIAWTDQRSPTQHGVYAQRVNERGEALWTDNGVELTSNEYALGDVHLVPDGSGGACFSFTHSGLGALFAGRVSSEGEVLWISTVGAIGIASPPDIASDGAGGVIVCWSDDRNGTQDIFAQRLNGNGDRLWGSYGYEIEIGAMNQTNPKISSAGTEAVIVWENPGSLAGQEYYYAQRVDTSGYLPWVYRVPVCKAASHKINHQVAISKNQDLAIVTWVDTRNGNSDIYAQALTLSSGDTTWAGSGVPVCMDPATQDYPQLTGCGAGDVIITWQDSRAGGSNYDIYAQRVEGKHGGFLWTTNGRVVCSAANHQEKPRIVNAGDEPVLVWKDWRSGQSDVYAQKLIGSGDAQWALNGVAITALGYQDVPLIAEDGEGGAIIAWTDVHHAEETDDIRAQRIFQDGRTGNPRPWMREVGDIAEDEGGYLRIELRASDRDLTGIPFPQISFYNVWRKIESISAAPEPGAPAPVMRPRKELLAMAGYAGCAAHLRLSGDETTALGLPPGSWESVGLHAAMQQGVYYFLVPTKQDSCQSGTHWETYVVSAHTSDPDLYFISSEDSGYSVDNVAPEPPLGLAGEQSYDPAGLQLTWIPNTEEDLWYYGVYRGTDGGFTLGPGNLVATPVASEWFDDGWSWDAGYWYKVSAVDIHGNESGYTLLGPDDITGTETPAAPAVTYLSQNFPNPFNPLTKIAFGLKERGRVSLRIYDTSGRLVRVLAEGVRPAGHYIELWDGRDSRGTDAASGLYFYRLTAGSFTETRKMVLLR
jgi:hypothetical protein